MTAKRLVLLRHGRTASNAEGRFQGHLDVPLDDVGLAQAEAAGGALAGELAEKVAAGAVRVVSSDLVRARRTAEIVAGHLGVPVTVDPALRERDGGSWQGLTREEIKARHGEEFARWMAGEDLVIGGGESLGQAWRRCEAASSVMDHSFTQRPYNWDSRVMTDQFSMEGSIRTASAASRESRARRTLWTLGLFIGDGLLVRGVRGRGGVQDGIGAHELHQLRPADDHRN